MAEPITFTDAEGNIHVIPPMAQGPAHLATPEELQKDIVGYTNPNLHRRIDPQPREEPEVSPREYLLSVGGVDSYRMTKITTHDENSTTSEIP